ncbi:hypothetical protein [Methylobacterium sp. 37f]|uniref:thermonuclease family protein n=1 Tax=Methylobacterium sp. 37f TaxID=2817058 RepID=UPI001FFC7C4F|nr:hypothetical protein [Methylobacterium sp. 37f]
MDERNPPSPVSSDARRDATNPDRAALRAGIADEIARQGVHPVAERTLALLAEAALVATPAPPGYRVIDRTGAPRHITDPDGNPVPMDVAALFAEFRERHPALFRPVPEPEPEPEPVVVPPPDVRAATARFVAAQSVRVRALADGAARRGRTLGAAFGGRLATLRRDRAARFASGDATSAYTSASDSEVDAPVPVPVPTLAPGRAGLVADRVRDGARRAGGYARGRIADNASRLREVTRDRNVLRDALSRPALLLGIGAIALVSLAALLGGRITAPDTAPSDAPPVEAGSSAQPPSQTSAATPSPSAPDMSPAPAEEAPPKRTATNEISGPVEVIDTATLRVGGKLVRLFGVEWVRGGQADELIRYLAGRTVTCQPVAGSEARLCAVDGRDLSEVVLFNGGGRASPEATPDLVAAEDHARAERLGVWAR